MIRINDNLFEDEKEALEFINTSLMDEENQFTDFNEASEYLINNGFYIPFMRS